MAEPAGDDTAFVDTNIFVYAYDRQAGASWIYTEDFQHGRNVQGVVFLNPFAG